MEHSDLVINFSYVLKLVRVDPLGRSLTKHVLHLRLPNCALVHTISITFLIC